MNEYLVKTLKEGRLNKGLKQSDVAEMVGVKPNTLSNYENGVSEPDIDTFANLCEIYGLDFAYVLGEAYGLGVSGTDFDIKPSEIEHIKKYRDLDDHGIEMVDFTLQKEWERATAVSDKVVKYRTDIADAAHERTDIDIPAYADTSDNDIMDDELF